MLPVSRSQFSAWCDMCLRLVRHVPQLGKTHVSRVQFLTQNTDFAFATSMQNTPTHASCMYTLCFAFTPTTFKRSSGTSGKSVVGGFILVMELESKSYSAVVHSISYANVCEHCKVGVAMFRHILVSCCLIMSLN